MRSPVYAFSFFTCAVMLSGCGGKILAGPRADGDAHPNADTGAADEPRAGDPTNAEEEEPIVVVPAVHASADACTVLCERDARCDSTVPAVPSRDGDDADCEARCRRRLADECGIDEWLLCYAARIAPDACTPLPEECRPSFCAWARCARQPVATCE